MHTISTKVCNKCKTDKPLSDFSIVTKKGKKPAPYYICKVCNCGVSKASYAVADKAPIQERMKLYYLDNKDWLDPRNRQWDEDNKELLSEWRKAKRAAMTPEERAVENARMVAYMTGRRKIDLVFDATMKTRNLICTAIRTSTYLKGGRTSQMLGCEWPFFQWYIESLFTEGMSWSNRNEWHIDHRTPLSVAENVFEVVQLNHWTNLQPLWAADNRKKGNSLSYQRLTP